MLCCIAMRKHRKTMITELERLLSDLQAFHPKQETINEFSAYVDLSVRVHGEEHLKIVRREWVANVVFELGRILKVLRGRSVLCTRTERQRLAGRLLSLRSEVRQLKGSA
jgi:hypothetical protein